MFFLHFRKFCKKHSIHTIHTIYTRPTFCADCRRIWAALAGADYRVDLLAAGPHSDLRVGAAAISVVLGELHEHLVGRCVHEITFNVPVPSMLLTHILWVGHCWAYF